MAVPVVTPRLGATVSEVTVIEWLVPDGGVATEGEPLLVVATDKVDQELPSPATGTLRHTADIDDVVKVGGVLGEIH